MEPVYQDFAVPRIRLVNGHTFIRDAVGGALQVAMRAALIVEAQQSTAAER
jgi:hypothetical protein